MQDLMLSKFTWKIFTLPTLLALGAIASDSALASPLIVQNTVQNTGTQPITSVDRLSDVQPTDWAYQALQSLVERYACIVGYPNGRYQGNRAVSRYEFAAGVSACLDRITELISTTDFATQSDLATLQRLQQEFATELATLRGRVDTLEARTAELENHQFSTTTTLTGSTITTLAAIAGSDETVERNQPVFQSKTQLNFDTSFTGSDRLRARLDWGNYNSFDAPVNTRPSDLGVAFPSQDFYVYTNTDNNLALGFLEYTFPIGDRTTVFLEGRGAYISDIVFSASSFDSDVDSLQLQSHL
jgi:Carbohydrate-selective porin, OprB family/S-layer homology domain